MKIRIDPLDTLYSEAIRRRAIARAGGCERCLTQYSDYKQLQCSHFFGRSRKSVRWDEDNAAGVCFGCHQYLSSHPVEHVEWFKERLGDKFDLLNGRQRTLARYIDRAAIKLYLQEEVRKLTETP